MNGPWCSQVRSSVERWAELAEDAGVPEKETRDRAYLTSKARETRSARPELITPVPWLLFQ
jgi:hypothetical protein